MYSTTYSTEGQGGYGVGDLPGVCGHAHLQKRLMSSCRKFRRGMGVTGDKHEGDR